MYYELWKKEKKEKGTTFSYKGTSPSVRECQVFAARYHGYGDYEVWSENGEHIDSFHFHDPLLN